MCLTFVNLNWDRSTLILDRKIVLFKKNIDSGSFSTIEIPNESGIINNNNICILSDIYDNIYLIYFVYSELENELKINISLLDFGNQLSVINEFPLLGRSTYSENNLLQIFTSDGILGISALTEGGYLHCFIDENILVKDILWQKPGVDIKNSNYIPNKIDNTGLEENNWQMQGIVEIENNLIIPSDQTLTIQPNTKLLFEKDAKLIVNGNLNLQGTTDEPIVFCGKEPGTQWFGISGNNSNSISLDNVKIRDSRFGIIDFKNCTINNSEIKNTQTGISLSYAENVSISNSTFKDCETGIRIQRVAYPGKIFPRVTLDNNILIGKSKYSGKGIDLNSLYGNNIRIQNNKISNFDNAIQMSYSNAVISSNNICNNLNGLNIFDSSPMIYENKIDNNDCVGIQVLGTSAPVLNGPKTGSQNRISNNSCQIVYSPSSDVLLDYGYNDIYSLNEDMLIHFDGRPSDKIMVKMNYWGPNFDDSNLDEYFYPSEAYVYKPYCVEANFEAPVFEHERDLTLVKFLSGTEKEEKEEYEEAKLLYQEVITDYPDSIEASAALKRLEYVIQETKRNGWSELKSYYEQLYENDYLDEFSYYSLLARISFNENNLQESIDNYIYKFTSAETTVDSLLSKVNILDMLWIANNGELRKKTYNIRNEFRSLVCKTENEYNQKRTEILNDALKYGYAQIANNNSIKNVMLKQNYPNPFNPTTTIEYTLPEVSNVELSIYNIKGELVKTLVKEIQERNRYSVMWGGKDNKGRNVASGVYFSVLKTNNKRKVQKMLLIK